MKNNRIIPVALAAALIAAGSASQALAEVNDHDTEGMMMGARQQMEEMGTQQQTPTMSTQQSGRITLDEAQRMAEQKVGGKTISATRFGLDNLMYKFDIKVNGGTKRVYVNGRNGRMTVASSLDAEFDPSVIGAQLDDQTNPNNHHHISD